MNTLKKPELLLPAGNLEKLKIAFHYGADSCYVGGNVFGLRKFADNFSHEELSQAVNYANKKGKKVYLVLNGFAHNQDMDELYPYFDILNEINPHALIISDMGVFQLAKEKTSIPIHISTQASVTNGYTCKFWKDLGAKRIVLAREVSLSECKDISAITDVELELFIHGAQCASYSGKCVISNYASGRDSNRGGCVQSCRHLYEFQDKLMGDVTESSHIMNARDLMSVSLIPELIHNRISSLKVEGRMKSNLYVANTAAVYRKALDECFQCIINHQTFDPKPYQSQLMMVSNRTFSTGGLENRPLGNSIHYETSNCVKSTDFMGTIKEVIDHQWIFVEVRNPFKKGDTLFKLSTESNRIPFPTENLFNSQGDAICDAKPNTLIKLPWVKNCHKFEVIHR